MALLVEKLWGEKSKYVSGYERPQWHYHGLTNSKISIGQISDRIRPRDVCRVMPCQVRKILAIFSAEILYVNVSIHKLLR